MGIMRLPIQNCGEPFFYDRDILDVLDTVYLLTDIFPYSSSFIDDVRYFIEASLRLSKQESHHFLHASVGCHLSGPYPAPDGM